MRKSTAVVASLIAFSSLAISLRLGDLATQDVIQVDVADGSTPTSPTEVQPTESAKPTTEEPATEEPAPAGQEPAAPKPPPAKPVTVESAVIEYKYGVVQVSVTMVGNEITDVGLLQGDTSNGREAAYVILADATIEVQGTNYGNVSGATFTTEAFKKAVESALAKF